MRKWPLGSVKTSWISITLVFTAFLAQNAPAADGRRVMSLDGIWQITEGSMDEIPDTFDHVVPVPGLVDLSSPKFESVGEHTWNWVTSNGARRFACVREGGKNGQKNSFDFREAFWYRKSFAVTDPVPAVALLKIHKARYGTKVFLNGRVVGGHLPNFTPGYFDLRPFLRGDQGPNELIIRVGAAPYCVPPTIPIGLDGEKNLYIPGIYDSVELILSDTPHIVRVQVVPEVVEKSVRVLTLLQNGAEQITVRLEFVVREANSGKIVGSSRKSNLVLQTSEQREVDVIIPIQNCRLWSPDHAFLYKLEVRVKRHSKSVLPADSTFSERVQDRCTDSLMTRFGMRQFHLDPETGWAMLNGKPYFMRGSSLCVFRFFEDQLRGDKPWREEWVRRFVRKVKELNGNTVRLCIGFPPEMWYRILDEEGILVQDEFPFWRAGTWPEEYNTKELIAEFTEWIQERWNHPCVVIWDASNETTSHGELSSTIETVRKIDLSHRPWDNSFEPTMVPGDAYEAHPYFLGHRVAARQPDMAKLSGYPCTPGQAPGNLAQNAANNPIIINEYPWLWLDRDGNATPNSEDFYEAALGPNSTVDDRRRLYARCTAMETEFWRSHRKVAGVLYFTILGKSHPGCFTSDNFLDIEKLSFEPQFFHYVSDAFAPVGVMIDFWQNDLESGSKQKVPVAIINDCASDWGGTVRLRMLEGEKTLWQKTKGCIVRSTGREVVEFTITAPTAPGDYQLVAERVRENEPVVRSWRDFSVLTPAMRIARYGLADGKPTRTSGGSGADAVDRNAHTRWTVSATRDDQREWFLVDLQQVEKISRVELFWHWQPLVYVVEASTDGATWNTVCKAERTRGRFDRLEFPTTEARYVRVNCVEQAHENYGLWEMRVFP